MRDTIDCATSVVEAIRDYLSDEGFLEVETPILTRSTPEGARDFLVPSRLQRGSWYALPQSPQLFKQLLMVGGLERYFQIARCFRDEDLRADRQPEFTQLDMEMSFVDEDDVIDTWSTALLQPCSRSRAVEVRLPLERVTYDEADAALRLRQARPRFGMEIHDLSDAFAGSGLRGLREGPRVGRGRARLPADGEWPRRRFDALTERARAGGAGPGVGRGRGGRWRSPIAKFLSSEARRRPRPARLGAGTGDVLLIVADARGRRTRARRPARRRRRAAPGATTSCGSPTSPCSSATRRTGRWDPLHHPVHRAHRRPGRRPRLLAHPRLRRDHGRVGARRGSIRINSPEVQEGLRRHGPRPRGGARALRLPARGARLRRAAARGIALGIDRLVA